MKDIILIVPPFEAYKGFPSGLAGLAVLLDKEGLNVKLIDMAINNFSWSDVEKFINQNKKTKIWGITCVTATYSSAQKICGEIKKQIPDSMVLIGGPHVTHTAEVTLKYHPEIDIVIRGEGEITILELMNALNQNKSLDKTLGISFRKSDRIITNPPRPLLENLDILPYSYEKVIDRDLYCAELFVKPTKSTTLSTSRGCPYSCSFCSVYCTFGKRKRYRSIEHIMKELRLLVERDYKRIYFEDDIFTVDKGKIIKLCKSIISSKIDITWYCETRIDLIDSELLYWMKKSGCAAIFFGIESLDERVLKKINKHISYEIIKKGVELTHNSGLKCVFSLQIGLPGETRMSVKKTITKLKKLLKKGDKILLSFTSIYHGTILFYQFIKKYNLEEDIYEKFNEPKTLSEFLANTVGHGIGGIHPNFLNKNLIKKGEIVHNIKKMRCVYSQFKKAFPTEIVVPKDEFKYGG